MADHLMQFAGLDLNLNGMYSIIDKQFYQTEYCGYIWLRDTEVIDWIEHNTIMDYGKNYYLGWISSSTPAKL